MMTGFRISGGMNRIRSSFCSGFSKDDAAPHGQFSCWFSFAAAEQRRVCPRSGSAAGGIRKKRRGIQHSEDGTPQCARFSSSPRWHCWPPVLLSPSPQSGKAPVREPRNLPGIQRTRRGPRSIADRSLRKRAVPTKAAAWYCKVRPAHHHRLPSLRRRVRRPATWFRSSAWRRIGRRKWGRSTRVLPFWPTRRRWNVAAPHLSDHAVGSAASALHRERELHQMPVRRDPGLCGRWPAGS